MLPSSGAGVDNELPPLNPGARWVPEDDEFIAQLRQQYFEDQKLPRVRVKTSTQRFGQPKQELAFTYKTGDPNIYLNAGTDVYKKAKSGDQDARQYIAGVLAHESAHLSPDNFNQGEAPAYTAQLDFLKKIGAGERLFARIKRTRDQELERERISRSQR